MQYRVEVTVGIAFLLSLSVAAQKVKVIQNREHESFQVTIEGRPFTQFLFSDTLPKPVLYPIHASNGRAITRGFPITPIEGEPTDHPHHLGLWLNYGDVNGLDFWNNSSTIPVEKRGGYGTVRMEKLLMTRDGETGGLEYEAYWVGPDGRRYLHERTEFTFGEEGGAWYIDRTTMLKAEQPVLFQDNKEGMLGLRVCHELQIPAKETKKYTDANGIVTTVTAVTDMVANGNYLASNGKQGDEVWSSKASWCMMYGKVGADSVSILIVDHPSNVGYPTHWHARGYGLFAANPLGVKVFTNGRQTLNHSLKQGESMTVRYRVVVAAGPRVLDAGRIQAWEESFAKGRG
ncbi:MAG: hypothetical protein FJX89_07245 [Bacteroidetes bacterium]|nr:hypothetical protein [Bacteroidota bacterium]